MTIVRKIKDKKVNFEFNKEFIKVVTDKIASNDAIFIPAHPIAGTEKSGPSAGFAE